MQITLENDSELIQSIHQGGISRERAASMLYQRLEAYVFQAMKKYRISEELAREAFHLAIQKTIQAIEFGQFEGKSKISTYFHPIFFHRCVDLLRREKTYKEYQMEDYMYNLPDKAKQILDQIQARENANRLGTYLTRLGENCRHLLIETEWKGYSLKEIAQKLNFASAAVAGTTKNRCLKKLKTLLQDRKDEFV